MITVVFREPGYNPPQRPAIEAYLSSAASVMDTVAFQDIVKALAPATVGITPGMVEQIATEMGYTVEKR